MASVGSAWRPSMPPVSSAASTQRSPSLRGGPLTAQCQQPVAEGLAGPGVGEEVAGAPELVGLGQRPLQLLVAAEPPQHGAEVEVAEHDVLDVAGRLGATSGRRASRRSRCGRRGARGPGPGRCGRGSANARPPIRSATPRPASRTVSASSSRSRLTSSTPSWTNANACCGLSGRSRTARPRGGPTASAGSICRSDHCCSASVASDWASRASSPACSRSDDRGGGGGDGLAAAGRS